MHFIKREVIMSNMAIKMGNTLILHCLNQIFSSIYN